MVYLKENYKKILPYAGIFFVLFMGSGLVKIPVGSVWFYVIKFGIISTVLGIGVSAWWKAKKDNLPPTTYLKLALFVPFTIDFHLHYAFIFLTIILFNKKLLLPWNSPLKPIYLLFIWGFISYVINQFVEFNPLSYPIFAILFFLPFLNFSLFYTEIHKQNLNEVFKYYHSMIIIVMVLILAQIIYLKDLHPDGWHGGTGDAHYAGIFIAISFLIIVVDLLNNNSAKRFNIKELIICIFTFPFLFFIDAKTIFIFTLVAFWVIVFLRFNKISSRIGFLTLSICFFLLWFNFSDQKLPVSILSLKQDVYHLTDYTNNYTSTDKFILLTSSINIFLAEPYTFFTGIGPGTYFTKTTALKKTLLDRLNNPRELKYLDAQRENIRFLLSPANSKFRQLTVGREFDNRPIASMFDWRSSLINILFEFGVPGLLFFLWFIIGFLVFGFINYTSFQTESFLLIIFCLLLIILFYNSLWGETIKFTMLIYSILGIKFTLIRASNKKSKFKG